MPKNNSKHTLQIIEEEEDAYYKTLKSNEQIYDTNNDTNSSIFNMNDTEDKTGNNGTPKVSNEKKLSSPKKVKQSV